MIAAVNENEYAIYQITDGRMFAAHCIALHSQNENVVFVKWHVWLRFREMRGYLTWPRRLA